MNCLDLHSHHKTVARRATELKLELIHRRSTYASVFFFFVDLLWHKTLLLLLYLYNKYITNIFFSATAPVRIPINPRKYPVSNEGAATSYIHPIFFIMFFPWKLDSAHLNYCHVFQSALRSPSGTALLKVWPFDSSHGCLIIIHYNFAPSSWTPPSSAVPGFDMMEAFGLTEKAHSSVEGVAAEPFVFNSVATYVLYKDTQLTQSTRWGSSRSALASRLDIMSTLMIWYNTMRTHAIQCVTVQQDIRHSTIWHDVMQNDMKCDNTIQSKMQYDTIENDALYNKIQYNSIPYNEIYIFYTYKFLDIVFFFWTRQMIKTNCRF